jgi:hypothetical protein
VVGRFEPFFSRWDAGRGGAEVDLALARGERSPQKILARIGEPFPVSEEEARELGDWDTREDVVRDKGRFP